MVLDPVLRSSSGRELLSEAGAALLRERLLPLVSWVTPNLEELGILTGEPVTDRDEITKAAYALQRTSRGLTILATGGHLEQPDDLLVTPEGGEHWLRGERVETTSTHGTGCALSSAVLSRVVLGDDAVVAARAAKAYVTEALRTAPGLGSGNGPLHHLWPLRLFSQQR